jgi:hypothetical protein
VSEIPVIERLAKEAAHDFRTKAEHLGIDNELDFLAGYWCNAVRTEPELAYAVDTHQNQFEKLAFAAIEKRRSA